jgi:MFS family permease
VATGTYALSFGLPTTINLLGYTESNAQLLTIPVYVFACIMTVINALCSDRLHLRSPFILLPYISGLIGTTICLTVSPEKKPGVIYFAMFLIASGLFPNTPAIVAWIANNTAGQWKRATAMALEFTFGNLIGGVVGSNIFLAREKPGYRTGYLVEVSFITVGFVVLAIQVLLLLRDNRTKAKIVAQAESEERAEQLREEMKDFGDKSPFFKYTL